MMVLENSFKQVPSCNQTWLAGKNPKCFPHLKNPFTSDFPAMLDFPLEGNIPIIPTLYPH